jgi:hypothetical protein
MPSSRTVPSEASSGADSHFPGGSVRADPPGKVIPNILVIHRRIPLCANRFPGQFEGVPGSDRPETGRSSKAQPLKSGGSSEGWKRLRSGTGELEGRSARRQPNPLSTTAVRRNRSFGSGTAKGFRSRGRKAEAKDPSGTKRRTLRTFRGIGAGFALPKCRKGMPSKETSMEPEPRGPAELSFDGSPQRVPSEVRFDGRLETGSPTKLASEGAPGPGPHQSSL